MMTTLEMLWQLLCAELALGLLLGEAEAEEEAEGAEEVEEVEVGDNQPLSLCNNSSLSQLPLTYKSWEHFPESSTEKEIRLMPS